MQPCCSSAPPLPGSRPSSHPSNTLPRALVPKASLLTPARTPRSLPQGTRPGQLPQDTFPDKALPPSLAVLISSPSHLVEAYWRRWGLSWTLDQAPCDWRSPWGDFWARTPGTQMPVPFLSLFFLDSRQVTSLLSASVSLSAKRRARADRVDAVDRSPSGQM